MLSAPYESLLRPKCGQGPVFDPHEFWDKYGLEATRDAFGVSRRTLYRWKEALREVGGQPSCAGSQVEAAQASENGQDVPASGGGYSPSGGACTPI